MYTVRPFNDVISAGDAWDQHFGRPGIVMVYVSVNGPELQHDFIGDMRCKSALVYLENETAVHIIGGDPAIVPRFDVAWFDVVEPPEWLGDMAKPGAVVLLSGQPSEGSGVA